MSTRASIIYDPVSEVHIYHEYMDGQIHLEIERDAALVLDVVLMSAARWKMITQHSCPICLHVSQWLNYIPAPAVSPAEEGEQ